MIQRAKTLRVRVPAQMALDVARCAFDQELSEDQVARRAIDRYIEAWKIDRLRPSGSVRNINSGRKA